ncbi:MAG: acyl carrier protein [Rhodospirillaceae bacterium]|nr:acyl carrier protein [Rhodospirillales bacterium]
MAYEANHVAVRIKGLVAERVPRIDAVAGDARIRDLGLDSVAVMDLVMAVEDQYEVIVPLERLAEIETVDDLIRVVCGLIQGRVVS